MTWAERATDANQMRHSDLKGREGGMRAELDKLWNDNTEHAAGWTEWLWHSSVYNLDRFIQTMATLLIFCSEILYSLCKVPLCFPSYLLYRCLTCLWGTRPRAPLYTVSGSFCFTCGIMLLETKGILLCEQCCSELGPGPARGLVQRRSALAWPQCAFLSHAAPDLLTHFLTQEIELTPQPGPWDPTDAYTAVH